MTSTTHRSPLPSLDETLERLAAVEHRSPEGARIEMTKKAVEANERFATDRGRVEAYLGHLASRNMFLDMYGLGNCPNGLLNCVRLRPGGHATCSSRRAARVRRWASISARTSSWPTSTRPLRRRN